MHRRKPEIERSPVAVFYLIFNNFSQTFLNQQCVLITHMDRTQVRLLCPECGKAWQSKPRELPESQRVFHCPNCYNSRHLSEFLRTEHDLQTLQQLQ